MAEKSSTSSTPSTDLRLVDESDEHPFFAKSPSRGRRGVGTPTDGGSAGKSDQNGESQDGESGKRRRLSGPNEYDKDRTSYDGFGGYIDHKNAFVRALTTHTHAHAHAHTPHTPHNTVLVWCHLWSTAQVMVVSCLPQTDPHRPPCC
jgi:hypothetical protein